MAPDSICLVRDIYWSCKHYNRELKIPNPNMHLFPLTMTKRIGTCNKGH